jgi:hypothetical protein
MKYTVVWLKAAQDHLADTWVSAPDKAAVTAASNAIDAILEQNPYANSKSRPGGDRVMYVSPLGVAYTVNDTNRMVAVWEVWRTSLFGESSNGQNRA